LAEPVKLVQDGETDRASDPKPQSNNKTISNTDKKRKIKIQDKLTGRTLRSSKYKNP
jgi:hypothetical protein